MPFKKGNIPWNKDKHHSQETKNKISLANKGKIGWNKGLPKEMHPRYGKVSYWKGKIGPMAGKHHTEETKKKISENCKGRTSWNKGLKYKNPKISKCLKEYYKNHTINNKGMLLNEEYRKKISDGLKGNIPWNKDKKKCFTQETIRKMSLARINSRKKGDYLLKPNKPEKYLTRLFQQYNLPFKYVGDAKFHIERFNPDFVWEEGKKIIEFDGYYWHNLPKEIVRDNIRNLIYLDAGYDVMLLNEDNLKDENKLINEIKEFLYDGG